MMQDSGIINRATGLRKQSNLNASDFSTGEEIKRHTYMCPSDADRQQNQTQRINARSYLHLFKPVEFKRGMKSMRKLSVADTLIVGSGVRGSSVRTSGSWWLTNTRAEAQPIQLNSSVSKLRTIIICLISRLWDDEKMALVLTNYPHIGTEPPNYQRSSYNHPTNTRSSILITVASPTKYPKHKVATP